MACSSSDDVFRHFAGKFERDGDGDISAFALMAYAIVESERLDWADHVAGQDGSSPSTEKVRDWFRDKPDSYFKAKEDLAVAWITGFARTILADEIEREREAAVAETVGDLRKFWPAFWQGNLIGLTSNIAFAFMVVLFVVVINTDFSFVAWARRLFGFH